VIDKEVAIAIATQRLKQVYPTPRFLRASHSDSLEEFEAGGTGWRVWFHVEDPDFGDYDRPVEVCDVSKEARLVRILL
jgi:hypothetical protein